MMTIAIHEPELLAQVATIVQEEGQSAEEFVRDAVQKQVMAYRQKRIALETESWYRMPAAERRRYTGQFVAIQHGKIVDSDSNHTTLLRRIRQVYGREPIALIEGGDQPMPTYRITSVHSA